MKLDIRQLEIDLEDATSAVIAKRKEICILKAKAIADKLAAINEEAIADKQKQLAALKKELDAAVNKMQLRRKKKELDSLKKKLDSAKSHLDSVTIDASPIVYVQDPDGGEPRYPSCWPTFNWGQTSDDGEPHYPVLRPDSREYGESHYPGPVDEWRQYGGASPARASAPPTCPDATATATPT
jgi:hypothetical protein